ncbi:ferritin-like domain-containing protein [Orrella sp. 11846]|uniref:ferritin-like domain-containing protein n=1 Tax=Orrella sp. 11846 TaxID=3409913 RepID=UPI003B5B44E9
MTSLTQQDIDVLNEALNDEYFAWTTYGQVIADFGELRPFVNIREAEGHHIEALTNLYNQYGVAVPENTWVSKAPRYESILEATEAAVKSETDNAEMYARLLKSTQNADIIRVLENLQDASQSRHLPAFKRFSRIESERQEMAMATESGCCGGCGGTGHD